MPKCISTAAKLVLQVPVGMGIFQVVVLEFHW